MPSNNNVSNKENNSNKGGKYIYSPDGIKFNNGWDNLIVPVTINVM